MVLTEKPSAMQPQTYMQSLVGQSRRPLSPAWLRWLVIFLVIVGIVFRFVNLNHKVYGYDEVDTSLRAAGYTQQGIAQDLFQNQVVPAKALLRFQQIKPGSTPIDTMRSLAIEEPQQSPLYFLLDRIWEQSLGTSIAAIFGSPLTAPRLLPALVSLGSLPFMYALAWELFAFEAVALLATVLLALSPFDVLCAQTARHYSLLTLTVIASHYLLLRAIRLSNVQKIRSRDVLKQPPATWQHWGLYALAVTIGLCTHPFFALTLVGHGVYVVLTTIAETHRARIKRLLVNFGLSLLAALVLYVPWLVVMVTGLQRTLATPTWVEASGGVGDLIKLWTFSLTALFLDLDFDSKHPFTLAFSMPLLLLIGLAFYTLYRRCDRAVWLFIATTTVVPFFMLVLTELILDSTRSTISHSLIPCFPSIQLAIASLLAIRLSPKPHYLSGATRRSVPKFRLPQLTPYTLTLINRWFWRLVLLSLFTASIASCTVSAASTAWWHGEINYFNAAIARRINATPSAMLLSDQGDDATNLSALISLSYRLKPTVTLLLLQEDAAWVTTPTFESQVQGATVMAFRPSIQLRQTLERSRGNLQLLLPGSQLWQIPKR